MASFGLKQTANRSIFDFLFLILSLSNLVVFKSLQEFLQLGTTSTFILYAKYREKLQETYLLFATSVIIK